MSRPRSEKEKKRARERAKLWRDAHPGHYRKYLREYHHRRNGYPAPTREQTEWCECCGRFLEKTPCLDHDHITGKFRGWLCSPCNRALGLLGDSIEGLEKAVAYLRRAA